MSAIWQKNLEDLRRIQLLSICLETREIPQVFLVPVESTREYTFVWSDVLMKQSFSWPYSAVIQVTYNKIKPA